MDPERRFFHPMTAFNYRLTNMQCAVLCAQLERCDEIIDRRRTFFKRYEENLAGITGLSLRPVADWAVLSPWVFCLTLNEAQFGCSRDQAIERLAAQGIESRPFYYPLHRLPAFRELSSRRGENCPVTDRLSEEGMYLPSSTDITDEDVDFVCEAMQSIA